jgi:hypothetical protein
MYLLLNIVKYCFAYTKYIRNHLQYRCVCVYVCVCLCLCVCLCVHVCESACEYLLVEVCGTPGYLALELLQATMYNGRKGYDQDLTCKYTVEQSTFSAVKLV